MGYTIELEPIAPYEGKFKVRSMEGLTFSTNPDSWFLVGRRGDYGLYVEGKGWLASDENCYFPDNFTKEEAIRIAKSKGIPKNVLRYFAKSHNEPIICAEVNLYDVGRTKLPNKVTAEFTKTQGGGCVEVDALDYCGIYRTSIIAISGRRTIPFDHLTYASKFNLCEELERVLIHNGHTYKRINRAQLKRLKNKLNKQKELWKSKEESSQ